MKQAMTVPMEQARQRGALNLLLIPLILLSIAFIGVSTFAYTASLRADDYKNNVDAKVEAAVAEAEKKTIAQKEKDFAEKEKFPYDTYTGPVAAGSLKIQYPKTWSAYVIAPQNRTTKPLDAYFYPGQVPAISDQNNSFALRVVVEQRAYDSIVKSFQGEQKSGKVTIEPYQSANVPSVVGVRVNGEIAQKKQGSMIILPFRDKTLQMWTESVEFNDEFDDIILKNFTLTP